MYQWLFAQIINFPKNLKVCCKYKTQDIRHLIIFQWRGTFTPNTNHPCCLRKWQIPVSVPDQSETRIKRNKQEICRWHQIRRGRGPKTYETSFLFSSKDFLQQEVWWMVTAMGQKSSATFVLTAHSTISLVLETLSKHLFWFLSYRRI